MSWDVTDTDNYYRTPEGVLVADILAADLNHQYSSGRMRTLADTEDQLAVGYPFPLYFPDQPLPPVFMLAETGVLAWIRGKDVITACVDSESFPCATEVFEQVFVSHALEYVANKAGFLAETWRCLKGEGKLVMIVPHRRSLWALSDKTPFGQGTPFSRRQLKFILEQAGFEQIQIKHSLYAAIWDKIACGHEEAVSHDWPHWLGDVWRRADRVCQEAALFNSSAAQSCVAAES